MNLQGFFKSVFGALLCLGFATAMPSARAELIGTDQVAQDAPGRDKAVIDNFISRAEVQKKMQALGLGVVITAQRIALLNDSEARALAEKINSLPAGGNFSSLTNSDFIIILLSAILLVLIL
ncbi:MAG: PA2779 family protein [Betaproteobacteria bacterium]|nr:PA2779 family protein [Betaproteobacteria bacterium]